MSMVAKAGTVIPKSYEYETPQDVYDKICMYFGIKPELDVCATPENAKCSQFFTKEDNALLKDWGSMDVWCTPPHYNMEEWVEKADQEAESGQRIMMFLPNLVIGNKYWLKYIEEKKIYHRTLIGIIGISRPKFLLKGEVQNNPRSAYIVVVWNK